MSLEGKNMPKDTGMGGSFFEDMERHRRQREKGKEGAHKRERRIPAKELEYIKQAMDLCAEAESASLDAECTDGVQRAIFIELEKKLDTLPLWVAKFSTSYDDAGKADGPLQENPEKDSIYYITPSNVALRLKKSMIANQDGLRVTQPATDLVVFRSPETKEVVLTPTLGFTTQEWLTSNFIHACADVENPDLHSPIVIFERDGRIVGIDVPPHSGDHNGNRVNKIFWQRGK